MFILDDAGKDSCKIILEVIFLCKLIQYEVLYQLYIQIFNVEAIMMTMKLGSLTFVRIQSTSDILVIGLLPFFLLLPKIRQSKKLWLTAIISNLYNDCIFKIIYGRICQFYGIIIAFRMEIYFQKSEIYWNRGSSFNFFYLV